MKAKTGRRLHLTAIAFWFAVAVVANITMEMDAAMRFLVNVSIYANIVGHWSGWSAERPSEVEK